jgi:chemotaxis protein MotB
MGAQRNAAPVIIKRKKVIIGGGHHGGAWKVAYADFVTAMMAFFLLMWLLNATTEKQRKGIADYFSPSIPLSRTSGGGDGAFGGDSIFSQEASAQNGTGAASDRPDQKMAAPGDASASVTAAKITDAAAFRTEADAIESALAALGGESMAMQNALRHITTRLTDEGLIVEIYDIEGEPLFIGESDRPTAVTEIVAEMIARVFALAVNEVAVNGHVRAKPEVLRLNPNWEMSAARAEKVRLLLEGAGLESRRMARVTGYADRRPALADPSAIGNNRIEIILLRTEARKAGPKLR